jgi:hypothetical protein
VSGCFLRLLASVADTIMRTIAHPTEPDVGGSSAKAWPTRTSPHDSSSHRAPYNTHLIHTYAKLTSHLQLAQKASRAHLRISADVLLYAPESRSDGARVI